jgi:hypothetical protein
MNLAFLTPYCVDSKIRVGKIFDGGYVLEKKSLDAFDILYGYGVGWDVSFEKGMNKRTKKPSRIFDPTMFDIGNISTYSKKSLFGPFKFFAKVMVWVFYLSLLKKTHQISFYNEGLGIFKKHKYDSFPNHLKRFGDEGKKIFLKIDIDGGEYEILKDEKFIKALDNVVQMAIEFHDVDKRFAELKDIIETINKKFTIVHFHGNNYVGVFEVEGKKIPKAIELTFLNNAYLKNKQVDFSPMPIPEMDYPNHPKLPDIDISKIFA